MKMNKLTWLLACFFVITVSAQEKLIVMGTAPNMYVVYPTNGIESLQNISNQFGLSVAKLSAFNNININPSAAFARGTEIKIPFTKDNLLQQPNDNSAPLYHVIKQGDNLYRIGQNYNKVPVATLREWNNLKTDLVKDGQYIMIGYLVNGKAPVEKKTEVKKEVPATIISPTAKEVADRPFADKKPVDKKEPVVTKPITKEQVTVVPEQKEPKKSEIKQPPIEVKKETVYTEYTPKEGDEGYFASGYAEHTKEQSQQFHSGDAATFKTISGWTDRKFYVLMNDVAPKTIVRISAPGNKNICAMVLGPLQETKGASGLLLRMSNSAASALGLIDPKFTVTVTYYE
jgi:LysM repeat protein